MSQKKAFARLFVSSLCVVLVALMLTGAVELGLDYYKDGSTASLKVSNEMTKRKTELLLLTAEALAELDSENAQEAKKYYEALALKEALEGQAAFYQSYKNRKDYHYFGKYYELFNNVYGADTLILGSSRAVYGVNPAVLESYSDLDGYSFYNYAYNGARPSFFKNWYSSVIKGDADYPTPKTVIYCVDWFMFDTAWMWRDLNGTDGAEGGALNELRRYMVTNPSDKKEEQTEGDDPVQSGEAETTEPTDGGKKEKMTPWRWLKKLWNGELTGIEKLGKSITSRLKLFSSRDEIPEMIAYVFSGKGESDRRAADKLRVELQSELDALQAEYEAILRGEVGKTEYPTVRIPSDDYSGRFVVDSDGNITSKYYKGWLPWEYNYAGNSAGTGPEFQERDPDRISYSANNVPDHIRNEINAFKMFLSQLKRDGVNVILVQLPDYNGGGVGTRDEATVRAHTEIIRQIADDKGIPFIDYDTVENARGESVANNRDYYSNWNHLNEKGAIAFSKLLAEDLIALLGEN